MARLSLFGSGNKSRRCSLDVEQLEERCLLSVGITEFTVPTAKSYPLDITPGPDGNLWFTEGSTDVHQMGRITPDGKITEFPLPADLTPSRIAAGSDGNLWVTGGAFGQGAKLGRVTTAGVVTEFSVPSGSAASTLGITLGPDGNIWFTTDDKEVGRVTPAGAVTTFAVPSGVDPDFGITAGPDGNVWFIELGNYKIARITPAGVITEFNISRNGPGYDGLATGPDGNLWFAYTNGIGRMTTSGTVTFFPLTSGRQTAVEITAGPDGALWFTEAAPVSLAPGPTYVGRITTSGAITEYPVPTSNIYIAGITTGPDHNLWFAESQDQIGHVVLNAPDIQLPPALAVPANNTIAGTVATVAQTDPKTTPQDYGATIFWGDGTSSTATVGGGGGGLSISGSHTFAAPINAPLTVELRDTKNNLAVAANTTPVPITQLFVTQLYHDLLQRDPDAPGLSFWVGLLNQGATDAQVAVGFLASAEYHTRLVDSLYMKLLGRHGDAFGLPIFDGMLAAGGSIEQVAAIILGSPEYFQRAGSSNAGFLAALYRDVLGRGVDLIGATGFGAALANGVPAALVAGAVLSSREAVQIRLQAYYHNYLGRDADPGGLAFFSSILEQGGTDNLVLAAILSSAEYLGRL